MENFYTLIGELTIPEERRDEFNKLTIQLLERCGIRKLTEMIVAGKNITVISHLCPDSNGIIYFDYSIFENKQRTVSSYNMNTCELTIGDCGFGEFGMAMMLLLTMQEAYSSTQCYLYFERKIVDVNTRALLIEDILGIRLRFLHRADLWGMYVFSKENSNCIDMSVDDILNLIPYDFEALDVDLFHDIWHLENALDGYKDVTDLEGDRELIAYLAHKGRDRYLYSIYKKILAKEDCKEYVKRLIAASLQERENMAKEMTEYGVLAEISLYTTPVTLVRMLAYTKSVDFWDLWRELATEDSYKDYIKEERNIKSETLSKFNLYKAMQRMSEDEFIGVWEERELKLSDEMINSVEEWKSTYDAVIVPDGFDMEKEMVRLLLDLNAFWNIPYVDEMLVTEYLQNKEDYRYQRGLLLLRERIEDSVELFPELTRRQAMQWISRACRSDFASTALRCLIRILSNPITRSAMFGF